MLSDKLAAYSHCGRLKVQNLKHNPTHNLATTWCYTTGSSNILRHKTEKATKHNIHTPVDIHKLIQAGPNQWVV